MSSRVKTGLREVDRVLDSVYARIEALEAQTKEDLVLTVSVWGWSEAEAVGNYSGSLWIAGGAGQLLMLPVPMINDRKLVGLDLIASSNGTAARTVQLVEMNPLRGFVPFTNASGWSGSYIDNTGTANFRSHLLKGTPIDVNPSVPASALSTYAVAFTSGQTGDRVFALKVTYR